MTSAGYRALTAALPPGGALFDVPYHCQSTELNCGPTALKMAMDFLTPLPGPPIEALCDDMAASPSAGVSTVKLAICAANLGFIVQFHTLSVALNPANAALPFYQEFGDLNLAQSLALAEEAAAAGVAITEKPVELAYLLSAVTPSSAVVVLLDFNIVEGGSASPRAYHGHFVTLAGYDSEVVYVHDPAIGEPKPFRPIPIPLFEAARCAPGTDQDCVILSLPASSSDDDDDDYEEDEVEEDEEGEG